MLGVHHVGCLSADDMGFGKAVQILTLFLLNPMSQPMPASTIPNWMAEIKKKIGGGGGGNTPEGEVIVCQKSKGITLETGTELQGQTIRRQEP